MKKILSPSQRPLPEKATIYTLEPYSYSHLAAMRVQELLPDIQIRHAPHMAQAIAKTRKEEKGVVDLVEETKEGGTLPLENGGSGFVSTHEDLLSRVKFCGEIHHRVVVSLGGHAGENWRKAKGLITHPQMISQCRKFIERHLPHAKIEKTNSTADAVNFVNSEEGHGWVTLASPQAIRSAGNLSVLDVSKEDGPITNVDPKKNITQINLFKKNGEGEHFDPTALYHTIITEVLHTKGSLKRVTQAALRAGGNLTSVQSILERMQSNTRKIYLEIERSGSPEQFSLLHKQLEQGMMVENVHYLGSHNFRLEAPNVEGSVDLQKRYHRFTLEIRNEKGALDSALAVLEGTNLLQFRTNTEGPKMYSFSMVIDTEGLSTVALQLLIDQLEQASGTEFISWEKSADSPEDLL